MTVAAMLAEAEAEARHTRQILDETWDTDDRRRATGQPFHMPKKLTDKMPSAFRRTRSAYGFLAAWRRLRGAVWTARGIPYGRLPAFAERWGKRLYETHERAAYDALCDGDVMFFEAWSTRLLVIDQAAEAAGLTIADRGTLLYAHGVLKGYADAAAKQLKALGGKWPAAR
jgi:hypothetical protein